MPPSPLQSGEKLYCVSYAPFRGDQSPLDPTTVISPAQIEEDMAGLAKLTDCVRIYAVDMGLEHVPEIAARHGLKVLLGVWISRESLGNQKQIKAGVALANRFPETVRAIVVGNEVLLRGEQSAANLEALIRSVRAQVRVPITYADVWEFWVRNRQLADAVDFVTVHILPYWEDLPMRSEQAAAHITSIRAHVAGEFPGREVLIGEAGWPSRGRMREGARPSPADQARVLHELVANSHGGKFNVNLIEAFDQPWKRRLEGTVGGYWGLFDGLRRVKFEWGAPVSNHPFWLWQAAVGLLLAGLIFALARYAAGRAGLADLDAHALVSVAAIAAIAGASIGEVVEAAAVESIGYGGWIRSGLLIVLAVGVPLASAAALAAQIRLPTIEQVIGPIERRVRDPSAFLLGLLLIATCVLAAETALGLTFNPRYLDFPWAALLSASLSLMLLSLATARPPGRAHTAELAFAALLVVCTVKIVWAETFANVQALLLCTAFLCLSFTLARARAAPG